MGPCAHANVFCDPSQAHRRLVPQLSLHLHLHRMAFPLHLQTFLPGPRLGYGILALFAASVFSLVLSADSATIGKPAQEVTN